jgi:hypothetical protein
MRNKKETSEKIESKQSEKSRAKQQRTTIENLNGAF